MTTYSAHYRAIEVDGLSIFYCEAGRAGLPNVDRYDPDLRTDEFAFLSAPGHAEMQTVLFYDYRTNVAPYPAWQAWMRKHQPKMLLLWGKYDSSFQLVVREKC